MATWPTAPAETPPTEPKNEAFEAVFLGRRVLSNGKLGEAWLPFDMLADLTPDQYDLLDRAASLFDPPKRGATPRIVCGVYMVEGERDPTTRRIRKLVTNSPKFERRHGDMAWVYALDARDTANKTEHDAAKRLDKLKADKPLEAELRRLKAAYKACHPGERTGFELAVLAYLRRAKP